MAANVESMAWAGRVAPWHGLGNPIGSARNSEEMLKLAGLDWTVSARPLFIETMRPSLHLLTMDTVIDPTPAYQEIEGYVAIVRDADGQVYGVTSPAYTPIQNGDIFALGDALIAHETALYETAGSLNHGATVWASIRLGDLKVFDDAYEQRVTLFGGHDGKRGIGAMTHFTRVVCQNTLNAAMKEASARWTRRHVGKNVTVQQLAAEADTVLKIGEEYADAVKKTAERLFAVKLSGGDLGRLLTAVYPIAQADIDDNVVDTDEIKRLDIARRMKAPDLANVSNTGWAFVQALSDHVFHFAQRQTDTLQEKRMSAVINGSPILERGLAAVEALV